MPSFLKTATPPDCVGQAGKSFPYPVVVLCMLPELPKCPMILARGRSSSKVPFLCAYLLARFPDNLPTWRSGMSRPDVRSDWVNRWVMETVSGSGEIFTTERVAEHMFGVTGDMFGLTEHMCDRLLHVIAEMPALLSYSGPLANVTFGPFRSCVVFFICGSTFVASVAQMDRFTSGPKNLSVTQTLCSVALNIFQEPRPLSVTPSIFPVTPHMLTVSPSSFQWYHDSCDSNMMQIPTQVSVARPFAQ